MRLSLLFLLPCLSFVSCSGSLDEEPAEKEKPKTENTETGEEPPPLPPPVDDGLKFAVPESTGKLMSEENKKTIVGPAPKPGEATEGDSVINVDPPKLPEPKLPDEE